MVKCKFFVNNPLFVTYCADGNMALNLVDDLVKVPEGRTILPQRILPTNTN